MLALLPLAAFVALVALLACVWIQSTRAFVDTGSIETGMQADLDAFITDLNRLTRNLGRRARPGDLEAGYLRPMPSTSDTTDRDLQYRMMNLVSDRVELADMLLYFPDSGRCLTRYHEYDSVDALLRDYSLTGVELKRLLTQAAAWRVFFPADTVSSPDVMQTQVGLGVADRFVRDDELVVVVLLYEQHALKRALLPRAVLEYGSAVLRDPAGSTLLGDQSDYAQRHKGETVALKTAHSGALYLSVRFPAGYAGAAFEDLFIRLIWLMAALVLGVLFLFALALNVESGPLRRLVGEWSVDGTGAVDVYAVVRDLFQEHQQASTQLGRYYALLRASSLERLISSTALSQTKCAQLKTQIGGFPDRFMVGYGSIDALSERASGETDLGTVMMINQLEAKLGPGAIVYMLEGARFLLILPTDEPALTRQRFEQVLGELNQRMELNLSVSLSDLCDSMDKVSAAYEQARLRHLGRDQALAQTGEDGPAAQATMMQTLLSLYQHMVLGEAQEARALTRQAFFQRGLDEANLEQRYHALSMILKMADRAANTDAGVLELPRYEPARTPKELLGALLEGVEQVATRVLDHRQRRYDNRREALLTYVHAHHADPNLYAATLAEMFGFSEKYIYVVFKEQTGESPASYIQRLRLQHAARLLAETELPIQQIAEEVGFQNVNTYNKAFKRYYGVNSSQYRESPPG